MIEYQEWNPTGWDEKIAIPGRDNWKIVAFRTRNSDLLEESNWYGFVERLSPVEGVENIESSDPSPAEIHRFGHWALGWFEIILVQPESEEEKIAEELYRKLEDYPVLDDEDYSQRCFDAAVDYWQDLSEEEKAEEWEKSGEEPEEGIPTHILEMFY